MSTIRTFSRNLPYIRQQFVALLGNTSTTVKFICIAVIFGYLLSFSNNAVRVLSITPGYILPPSFWVWTTFTFCFLELHFWEVLVDIITVGLCGKLMEPLWGQMEMLTFFAITNIGVGVLTAVYYLFLYMCTASIDHLFFVHIHGLAGYVAAVSVAVKQIMPEHILAHTPIGKISNRNIPLSVLALSCILWLLGLVDGTHPAMFCFGLLISWIYLRFYQRHSNGSKGDTADSFTFVSFFPNVMQPPIAIIGNSIFSLFVKIGICKSRASRGLPQTTSSIHIPLSGVDPHDMERRRQMALKALSERLSKTSQDPSRQMLLPKPIPMGSNSSKHPSQTARQHSSYVPPKDHFNKQYSFKVEERTLQASDSRLSINPSVDTVVSIPETDIYNKEINKG